MSDGTSTPSDESPDAERLDDLGERIEAARHQAEEDLEPGGEGRIFADEGVRREVDAKGDTEHPPFDR